MRLSQARGNRSQAGGHTCRPYNVDGVGAFGKGAQTARPHGRAMRAPTVKTAARFRCRGRWSGLPLSLPGPHCGRFFRRRRRVCSVGRSDSAHKTHRRPPPGEAGVTSIHSSGMVPRGVIRRLRSDRSRRRCAYRPRRSCRRPLRRGRRRNYAPAGSSGGWPPPASWA